MEQELRELGLSEYEVKTYITLLKEGTITGNKLSRLSKVPQGKIYHTLHKLADKGFITILNSKPKFFKANDPSIAIKQHIKKQKQKLYELEHDLPKTLKQLKRTRKQETDEKVSLFLGKKNTFAPIWHLFETAQSSIDFMFTFEKLQHKSLRLLLEKQKQGIKIRVLGTKMNKPLMKQFVKYGFQVRYYPVEELRIINKDKKESVIMIVNPKDLMDRTSMLIESKELSKGLAHYFDQVWRKAKIIK